MSPSPLVENENSLYLSDGSRRFQFRRERQRRGSEPALRPGGL